MPSPYQNQFWLIVQWTPRKKLKWSFDLEHNNCTSIKIHLKTLSGSFCPSQYMLIGCKTAHTILLVRNCESTLCSTWLFAWLLVFKTDFFLSAILGVCSWSESSLTYDGLSCSEIGLKTNDQWLILQKNNYSLHDISIHTYFGRTGIKSKL